MNLQTRLLLSTLLLAGCAPSPRVSPPTTPNDSARAAWAALEIRDYRFDFERQCFCVREAVEPVTIDVRSGEIAAVRSRSTGDEILVSDMVQWHTVEELFRLIEEAEAEGQDVRVEYDTLGYPRRIEIGSLAADAGVIYTISRLERLP